MASLLMLVLIHALLSPSVQIKPAMAALQAAAVAAGCPEDDVRVRMRKEGPYDPIEVWVECGIEP